ncbi:nkf protein [Gordonia phage Morgana]|uniref:Nkf protein n=1 Tax=Gordonia phage Morgana TaxID=3137292 RepID=A0AAX4RC25_9CAUD
MRRWFGWVTDRLPRPGRWVCPGSIPGRGARARNGEPLRSGALGEHHPDSDQPVYAVCARRMIGRLVGGLGVTAG